MLQRGQHIKVSIHNRDEDVSMTVEYFNSVTKTGFAIPHERTGKLIRFKYESDEKIIKT